ncbi:glycosyltransferase [Sphingopyxis sp. KK2]|uniref:glycosyltransferase family protein n=1 Tax=Sphingopyxis sp. KK2 TaxID=1855727 RepID=UPI00097E631C|nr:glycosyltransferase [Sphingopyxis sp. KK2]
MKILYIQYANPGAFPAAMRAGRLWRAEGHAVRYLGVGFGDVDPLAVASDLAGSCDWVSFGRLTPVRFAARAASLVADWKPDWLYIADATAALLCAPLRLLHRGGIVYHEHDSPIDGASARLRAEWKGRNAMARRADAVVLPNADRAALLAADARLPSGELPIIAWNTPCREEVGPPRAAAAAAAGGAVRIVYAGSINVQRVPLALIDALAAVPGIELTVIGYETVSSRGHCDRLRAHAASLGCADRLLFRGAMPYHDLLTALQDYDVTFAALPVDGRDLNLRHMAGASNKTFDAIGQGLALIVGPGRDWRDMFVEPGFAVACDPDDAVSIAEAFRRLGADRDAVRAMGERARQRMIADWAYDEQFRPVMQRMGAGGAS